MRKTKRGKVSATTKALQSEIQRQACASIEDRIYWHIGGVSAISKKTGFPEVGSVTAVRWKERTFLLTAGHVIDGYLDDELTFVFRPPGKIERGLWWQRSTPGPLYRSKSLKIIRRFRSHKDDIAAIEVDPSLEASDRLRFYDLHDDSKIIRPISSSLCAIGLPFDSMEHLAPAAAAFSMTALWGNVTRPGKHILRDFSPRKNLLMEFMPADDGRRPGGFSGAGAWYQSPTVDRPIVWTPAPILAGLITDYYKSPKALSICRVERLVAFLREVSKIKSV